MVAPIIISTLTTLATVMGFSIVNGFAVDPAKKRIDRATNALFQDNNIRRATALKLLTTAETEDEAMKNIKDIYDISINEMGISMDEGSLGQRELQDSVQQYYANQQLILNFKTSGETLQAGETLMMGAKRVDDARKKILTEREYAIRTEHGLAVQKA